MLNRFGAFFLVLAIAAPGMSATAASLPAIKSSSSNTVPECVTPGRIEAFLRSRNPSLASKFSDIGVYYMRHGEDLGIRWDMAFYQMVVETNSLRYTGDVKPEQNNFAGLGATGGGVKGEYFKSVSDGVRGHLEHVLMYTGTHIENPVAERTRKVQEWKVLVPYQRSIRGPMTFSHLGKKWAPNDRGYSQDIKAIENEFMRTVCSNPDPKPQLVALARGNKNTVTAKAPDNTPTLAPPGAAPNGNVSVEAANQATGDNRFGLGAGSLLGLSKSAKNAQELTAQGPAKIQDTTKKSSAKAPAIINDTPAASKDATAKATKSAYAAGNAKEAELKPETGKCKVWTASYGGARAIIIKAPGNGMTNYTVLDVHAGKEKREADAYIAAYAKGGETIAEFDSPSAALDKAFKLCPEK